MEMFLNKEICLRRPAFKKLDKLDALRAGILEKSLIKLNLTLKL